MAKLLQPRGAIPLVAGVLGGAFVAVALLYEGKLVWPPLATEFAATVIGVFLALWLERELARNQERRRIEREEESERQRRSDDEIRAFFVVGRELETIERSLFRIGVEHRTDRYLVVDLPSGSWEGFRGGLGLVARDLEFVASLSSFYARIDDLRYRLRLKLLGSLLYGPQLDEIEKRIDSAVEAAIEDVGALLEKIVEDFQKPGGGGDRGVGSAGAGGSSGISNPPRELARRNMTFGLALFALALLIFGGTIGIALVYLALD